MKAKIKDLSVQFENGCAVGCVTLRIPSTEIDRITKLAKAEKEIDVEIKEHRNRRTPDANAMMWACLQEIADAVQSDKWQVYLQMLKRYGRFTYICVKPEAVAEVKKQWRESEIVGDVTINGKPAVQMLCYYGSSTYDTKEFSVLLDGIISEMKEMGLQVPRSDEMQAALERWGK